MRAGLIGLTLLAGLWASAAPTGAVSLPATATPTATVTPTPRASATPTATPRLAPAALAGASAGPTTTPTIGPSSSPTATFTASATATLTATPSPTVDANAPLARVLVKVKPGLAISAVANLASAHGAVELRRHPRPHLHLLGVPREQLEARLAALRADPRVVYAEPDRVSTLKFQVGRARGRRLALRDLGADGEAAAGASPAKRALALASTLPTPNDPHYPDQWALPIMQAVEGWSVFPGSYSIPSNRVRVAVLLTGADFSHPDLAGQLDAVNAANCVGVAPCVPGAAGAEDVFGEGTFIAGLIAAITNNGIGVAGLGFPLLIVPVKVCDDAGSCADSDTVAGIEYARTVAQVILHINDQEAYSQSIHDAIQDAIASDVVFVASVDEISQPEPGWPANYQGVFAVSASCAYAFSPDNCPADAPEELEGDSNFNKKSYTNPVTLQTECNMVRVAAPADDLWSTIPVVDGSYIQEPAIAQFSGAYAAAVVGMVRMANRSLSAAQAIDIVQRTADKVGPFSYNAQACDPSTTGWSQQFGFGRVNLARAVAAAVPSPTPTATPTATATATPTPAPTATPTPAPGGGGGGGGGGAVVSTTAQLAGSAPGTPANPLGAITANPQGLLSGGSPVTTSATLDPGVGGDVVAGNLGFSFSPGALTGQAGPLSITITANPGSVPIPGGSGQFSLNGTVFSVTVTDANGNVIHNFPAPFQIYARPNAADLAMAGGNLNAETMAYLVDAGTPARANPNGFPVGTWVTFPPTSVTRDAANRLLTVSTDHLTLVSVFTNPVGWVQTLAAGTPLLSSFAADAQTFGTKGQFSYLQVTEPQIGERLIVIDPATGNYAYVNARDVGPSGPPPAKGAVAAVRSLDAGAAAASPG